MMDNIKKVLKIKAADQGIRITKNDPINLLIDVITLWIKENNKALLSDLLKKAAQIDATEKRERIKQAKYVTDIISKIPLELSQDQKTTIKEQVLSAMEEELNKLKQPWWKTPIFLLCATNLVLTLGILLALISQ